MDLLVLGGTRFLGRSVVEDALQRGHRVTLFHRGRTNPGLFPAAESVIGDRDGDLSGLAGRAFDAVVDTSGHFPRQIRAVADALGTVGHYCFVSSMSVYADPSVPGLDETAGVATIDGPDPDTLGESFEFYGALKARCERAAVGAYPGRAQSVRAGLIVGPHDPSNRFPYWVARLAEGGAVLAPEPRDQRVQFIDVRDLASWILDCADRQVTGVFNASSPAGTMTMASALAAIAEGTGSDAELRWVDESFLVERDVAPWTDLPLWLAPHAHPSFAGFQSFDTSKAAAEGLACRPVADTGAATLEWLRSGDDLPEGGLSRRREAELLAEWDAR